MSNDDRRDLFPGALEMMILQTLRRQPLHGYAIAKHIRETSADLLQVEEGTLYPALQRLLREKWVQAEWGISPRNRRVRIYHVTRLCTEMTGSADWRSTPTVSANAATFVTK